MYAHITNRRWLTACLFLLVCGLPAPAVAERGLLYELKREGEAASYLLGTMHTDDPRVVATVEPVSAHFDRAKRLVLEMVLDEQTLNVSAEGTWLPEGTTLSGLLGEAVFHRLLPVAVDYGLTEPVLQRMKPWAVAVTLSLPPSSGGLFLDRVLYQRAIRQRKPVHGLETIDEQLSVFDRMPLDLQLSMLVETLNNHHKMPQYWQALLTTYLTRDLGRLHLLAQQQMTVMDKRVTEWFDQQVIRQRNARMLERMIPLLSGGSSFIAVGALHLPGKEGLLQGLESRGFRIRVVW